MFPHAASQNLRLFAINMREYPGSSPFTDAEVANLVSSDEAIAGAALFDQVKDIAYLIAHIIKTEDIPAPVEVDGRKAGGVSVLAWSGGNAFLFSLLANSSALDADVGTLLGHYITYAIVYGKSTLIS